MITTDDAINVERALSMNLSEDVVVYNISVLKGIKYKSSTDSLDTLFYPTAGLMTLSDHQNLLKMYGKGEIVNQEKRNKIIKLAIPYVAVFVLMLIITVSRVVTYSKKNKELKELQDYNNNPSNMMLAAEYDLAAANVEQYSGHVNALRLLEKNIDSYPLPTSEIEKIIKKAAVGLGEVTTDSYDASQGKIGVTATFKEVDMVNTFIDRLDAEDCFYEVNYTGYSEINSSGQWVANLECILSESAGR